MSVIDDYLETLDGDAHTRFEHMYAVGRSHIPGYTEKLSYNLPALMYKGKGVTAVQVIANGFSFYPFCTVDTLGIDVDGLQTTKGSIHFSATQPLSDTLLITIINTRLRHIDHIATH